MYVLLCFLIYSIAVFLAYFFASFLNAWSKDLARVFFADSSFEKGRIRKK